MTRQEYENLQLPDHASPLIDVAEIKNKEPRTLLYGYTVARDTFHVFLRGGLIHRAVYRYNGEASGDFEAKALWDAQALIPDKRLYPEACDAEFCALLLTKKGIFLPFTTFNTERTPKQFHGWTSPTEPPPTV